MTRLDRKTSLAWAANTYASPSAAASYRIHNLTPGAEKAVQIPNSSYVGKFEPSPIRPGGRFMTVSFSRELRGSETDSSPPADGALLRACGLSETASGLAFNYEIGDLHLYGTGPTSAGILDPISLALYQDGLYRLSLIHI